MLTNLLGSTFLILAVFLIRLLFREKTSRRFTYALWLTVLVRLLMPVPLFDLGIEPTLPISHDIGAAKDRDFYYPPITGENPDLTEAAPTAENPTPTGSVSPQPAEKGFDWARAFKMVHITGASALALWFGYVNISLYKRLKKDRVRLEAPCGLPVYKTNVLTTPCLFGVIKPSVYLTDAACEDAHMHNVITHEMCHYRHRDNLWNFLGMVCVCLWWFSPLVWLSFFTAKRDGELACDELALEILGENGGRNYGVTLIEMAKNRPHGRIYLTATISGGGKEMKERVKAIANKPKNIIWACLIIVCLMTGCAVIGFSGAEYEQNDEKYQSVADVLNNYAVQYKGISGEIYTYAINPHTLSDYEINKYYKIIQESGAEGLMEDIIESLKGNPFTNNKSHKIVTTLPFSEGSDSYRAYDLLKGVLTDFYEKGNKKIFNKDGENITDKFTEDTYTLYNNNDWGSIIACFKENVGFVREHTSKNAYFDVNAEWTQTEYILKTVDTPVGEVDIFHGLSAIFNYSPESGRFDNISPGMKIGETNHSRLRMSGMSGGDSSYLSKTESIFMCDVNMTYTFYNEANVSTGAYSLTHTIMLEPPVSLSAYTPALIKDFDGVTMVVDPIEYITPDDTERIAELELDADFDLVNGYYIHNETEENIPWKVGEGAVFEIVDWNRQFTRRDSASLFYVTESADEFLEYCASYDGGMPTKTPFFFILDKNGSITKLQELILP